MTAMMIRPMDGKDLSQLRVAIIHFWLTGMRGRRIVVQDVPKGGYLHECRAA